GIELPVIRVRAHIRHQDRTVLAEHPSRNPYIGGEPVEGEALMVTMVAVSLEMRPIAAGEGDAGDAIPQVTDEPLRHDLERGVDILLSGDELRQIVQELQF